MLAVSVTSFLVNGVGKNRCSANLQSEAVMSMTGFAYSLRWTDFGGAVPRTADAGTFAFVATNVSANAAWSYDLVEGARVYKVDSNSASVTVNRNAMWARPSGRTDALLRHEQGHYDISALLVRQAEQEHRALIGNTYSSQQEVLDAISDVRTPLFNLLGQLQSSAGGDGTYDLSTNHGMNPSTQSQWNRAFASCRADPVGRLQASLTAAGITI